jgi:Ca-activated chloride channel family protein
MKTSQKLILLLLASAVLLCAKTATEYFRQGAFQYADAKFPSAAIEVREGLSKYPSDTKLQMLLKRIEDAMKEQKDKNQKDNSSEKNQDQNSSSSGEQGSSNSQDKQSSNSKPDQSSNSQKGASSDSQGASSSSESSADSLQPGELNRDQAEQLLKDFQENDKERKRNVQMRGRSAPEKDW